MSLTLPDVSEFQSPANGNAPNWAGIKAQNGGAAIIRVSYGNGHLDTMFVSNYTQLKANNYQFIGLYQYLRAGQDAASQANAFCNWVGPISALFPGSIPILDLEEGSGNQSSRANQWFSIVDNFYGLNKLPLSQRSWLYSGQNFAVSAGLAPIFNSARRTWVAAYQSSEAGLLPHTLWQSTDGQPQFPANRTNWAGCGFVDTSLYHGSLDSLAALGWHPQANPPPVEDPNPAQPEETMIPNDKKTHAIAFGNGQYDWISFFADPSVEGKTAQALRVAPWDANLSFTGITTFTLDQTNEKFTVQLPAHCAGISIQRQDDSSNWVPVAYNLGTNS